MNKHLLNKARVFEAMQEMQISEQERPAFHVTGTTGWINDPNGFSYYKNEYHLFYQYHPYSMQWGPMHWGHMKSSDLIKWERLPIAMAPDELYDRDGCFSGSALELKDGRQLLMYTGVEKKRTEAGEEKEYQTQCIAYGDGINYEKAQENPVIGKSELPEGASEMDFRDPKIWCENEKFYVVTVNRIENGAVLLHESEDLVHWKYCGILDSSQGELGSMWECPDFFPLDGKQILMVSPMEMKINGEDFHVGNGTVCSIGSYDKQTYQFKKESQHLIDYGIDFYAPQTMETPDKRRVMIAWMQAWSTSGFVPEGAKYFGQMTVPRELSVKNGRLYQNPVRELEKYRKEKVTYSNVEICKPTTLKGIEGRILDMTVELLDVNQFHDFTIRVASDGEYYTLIKYDSEKGILWVDRSNSGFLHDIVHARSITVKPMNNMLKLRILLDRFSMEIFINDGEKAASFCIYTPQNADGIIFDSDGEARINIEKYSLME